MLCYIDSLLKDQFSRKKAIKYNTGIKVSTNSKNRVGIKKKYWFMKKLDNNVLCCM